MTPVLPCDCREPTDADLAHAVGLALTHPNAPERVLAIMAARLANLPHAVVEALPPLPFRAMIDRAGVLITEAQDHRHADRVAAVTAARARERAEQRARKAERTRKKAERRVRFEAWLDSDPGVPS